MKKSDVTASLFLFFTAIIIYWYAGTFPFNIEKNLVLNPGFYPRFLSIIMIVLALLLLITSLKKKYKDKESLRKQVSKESIVLTFLTLLMVLIYPIGLQYLGFLITTLIFTFVLTYFLSDRNKYDIKTISFASLLITLIVFFVFDIILNIPFPKGIF